MPDRRFRLDLALRGCCADEDPGPQQLVADALKEFAQRFATEAGGFLGGNDAKRQKITDDF